MAKIGGGSQQQQTKNDPWDGLKPYLIGLDGKTGIMPEAERLYKEASPQYYQGNTYAGLNGTQQNAMDSLAAYYKSPESMAGANAAANVGGRLIDSGAQSNQTGYNLGSDGANQSARLTDLGNYYTAFGANQSANMAGPAPMTSSGPMGTNLQSMVAPQTSGAMQSPQITIQNATAATSQPLGSSGVDWRSAIGETLKGDVTNPHLSQIADTVTRKATDNFATSIMPQIRGGAQMAGQFGGSRQGVVEANAMKDLNQGISDSLGSLYGNAYNQAQQAKNASALQLSGQESGERIQNNQISAQAALQQAAMANQRAMQDAQLAYQAQRDNNQFQLNAGDLALRSQMGFGQLGLDSRKLGLDSQIGLGQLGLANQQFGMQQQQNGVGLLNQAAQQPINNFTGLLGLGNLQQQDQQNQINSDVARWNYNQTAPWQNLENYMGLVTGSGGRYGEGMGSSRGFNWGLDFTQQGGGSGGGMGDMAKAAVILSDRRTKRNIVKIGSRPDGLNIYAYNYLWSDEPQIGVMADEVKQIKPHAVITLDNGLMAVNYGAL